MATKKQLAVLARGRATLAKTRAKNPRKCRGRGPEKKRVLACRGKRDNPRRFGESETAYALRLESEMRGVKQRMGAIESIMKKISKRKNPENPKRHFPKTKRGRPEVNRRWSIAAYNADGRLLKRATASTSKDDAYKQARGMVGRALAGSRVAKVILDGPK